jgi:hypothetical protein
MITVAISLRIANFETVKIKWKISRTPVLIGKPGVNYESPYKLEKNSAFCRSGRLCSLNENPFLATEARMRFYRYLN